MEELIEKIQALGWPELVFNGNITIQNSEKVLLYINGNNATFHFLYRKDDNGIITYEDQYAHLKRINFSIDFDINSILTRELKLRHYKQLNDVFKFNNSNIENITITNDIDNYEIQEAESIVSINPENLIEILGNYTAFYDGAKSYFGKYLNYKETEFQRSYFGIEKERKTLTSKGEFAFLIDRFNLPTKRNKADFEKYLNENDLVSLQEITLKLIRKEIFGDDFLTKLNDYFIKVRLEEIVKLGREIQSLRSPSTKTATARRIITKVESQTRTHNYHDDHKKI